LLQFLCHTREAHNSFSPSLSVYLSFSLGLSLISHSVGTKRKEEQERKKKGQGRKEDKTKKKKKKKKKSLKIFDKIMGRGIRNLSRFRNLLKQLKRK
jgi:hypothetical protein